MVTPFYSFPARRGASIYGGAASRAPAGVVVEALFCSRSCEGYTAAIQEQAVYGSVGESPSVCRRSAGLLSRRHRVRDGLWVGVVYSGSPRQTQGGHKSDLDELLHHDRHRYPPIGSRDKAPLRQEPCIGRGCRRVGCAHRLDLAFLLLNTGFVFFGLMLAYW